MQARAPICCSILLAAAGGCANDPQYLSGAPMMHMEAGVDDGMGGTTVAKSSLMLPIKPETAQDAATRMALATKLGVMVPYVKVGDLDIEVEYTITNLDTKPAQAMVELNGANEWFVYDPSVIVVIAGEEAPPTPGLQGDVPIDLQPNGTVDGVFREDQLLEASIDCDQVTRANVSPFKATLTIDKNDSQFDLLNPPALMATNPTCEENPDDPQCLPTDTGVAVPRAAFAELIRIDLVFKPQAHMTLDYDVRVRDHRGIMHRDGLSAPSSQIVQFAPAIYMP